MRHLLHHTSGIPEFAGADAWSSRYGGDDALEQQVRSFARFPLAHAPGAAFEYSNANYETLGLIVNAEDMGHYLIAQMNGGKYGAVQLLSAQGIAELHR